MWPFKTKVRQRRLEIRKAVPPAERSLWRRFRDAGGLAGVLLMLGFYVLVLILDIWPLDPLGYRAGGYLPQDVRARVSFQEPSTEPVAREPSEDDVTPASFALNEELIKKIAADLRSLPDKLTESSRPAPATQPAPGADAAETRPATRPAAADQDKALAKLLGPGGRDEYDRRLETLLAELRRQCILSGQEAKRQIERKARNLYLHGAAEDPVVRPVTSILSAAEDSRIEQIGPERLKERLAEITQPLAAPIGREVLAYLEKIFVTAKSPLYVYDEQRTQKDMVKSAPPPGPDEPKLHLRGTLLVAASRGTRPDGREQIAPLSAAEVELLRLEHEAFKSAERRNHSWRLWARVAGRAAIVLATVLALCAYIARYDPAVARSLPQAVRVAVVLAVMLALVKFISSIRDFNVHAVLMPVVMGAMVFTIAYEQRFGLALGGALAVLAALQLRAPLSLLIVLVTAVVVSVFLLREIRTRSKLIEVAAITAAGVFAMVWTQGWVGAVPARFTLIHGLWAAGCALLAGFLIQGLLPVIERIFGIATSMTLLEWCDASKPLLRNLAMQAPGTYNHSLQLGAMCEAAAEAIGARGLLARTGAYYHDIGKINKPQYFVENEAGSASKHAKLSPAMSLLIITGHVKDGLEMAREYGLPRVLREFIATHHGTTLVQYFYQAAAEQRKKDAELAPDEMEFRYPGPKPRAREAAILMLADASESSVRSMVDPTPGRIENQVHTMVSRRLMDGQLDECDLTLKEVHAIEASLVRSLCGIYHARIAYPTPAGKTPSAAEAKKDKPAPAGGPPAQR